jgi:hypothetical protein
VEADARPDMGAVVQAAPTAAAATIGAGAIILESSPRSGRAVPAAKAATVAPSGAVAAVAATIAAAVATATIAATVLLLMSVRRLLSPRGGRAAHSRHDGRIAAPHLPQAVRNGRQLLRSLELVPREVLAVPIPQHPEIDGAEQLLQGRRLEGVEARQHHRRKFSKESNFSHLERP